jgi:hypothetical protein
MPLRDAIRFSFCLVLAVLSGAARAGDAPAIGFWERLAATDPHDESKLVDRVNVIFTNRKLTTSTLFSALKDGGDVACCMEVSDLTPLGVSSILRKHHFDDDVANHLKSVKGLPYVYAAHVSRQSPWTPFMKSLQTDMSGPNDLSPYWSPAIGMRVDPPDSKAFFRDGTFRAGHYSIRLRTTYGGDDGYTEVDAFDINGQKFSISSKAIPTE